MHTPPWRIERNHEGKVIGISEPATARSDLDFVCAFHPEAENTAERAALLTAAPLLFESCKEMLERLEKDEPFTFRREIIERALYAIREASVMVSPSEA